MNGYIKLDRRIMRWGWYDDNNTKALWLHLLLSAYWDDDEYHGEIIRAGSFPTTIAKLSEQTGMTAKQIRNSLEKLKKTEEIRTERRSKYLIVSIVKWSDYQGERAIKGQSKGIQRAFKGQSLTINEEYKEYKNMKNTYIDRLPTYDTSSNEDMDETEAEELLTLMGRA